MRAGLRIFESSHEPMRELSTVSIASRGSALRRTGIRSRARAGPAASTEAWLRHAVEVVRAIANGISGWAEELRRLLKKSAAVACLSPRSRRRCTAGFRADKCRRRSAIDQDW